MNKKLFGVKLSTYLMIIVCLLAALMLWIFVNLPMNDAVADYSAICNTLIS